MKKLLITAIALLMVPMPGTIAGAQERMIDLTQVIQPTTPDAQRKFVVRIHDALQEIHGKVRPEGEWYVMSDVDLMGHVGTHMESPFHCLKKGADLSQISLERLVGDAVILNLTNAKADAGVTLQQVQDAAKAAGGIRKDDIVFCRMGPTPFFATEPLKWLVAQGMKMMGVDSGGVELANDTTHSNVNHLVLFRAGIPLIENLANLDRISRPRVKVYALPVPVRGLDAFPLRVIAVER